MLRIIGQTKEREPMEAKYVKVSFTCSVEEAAIIKKAAKITGKSTVQWIQDTLRDYVKENEHVSTD